MALPAHLPELNVYSVLATEHRLIERGLDLLERVCDASRRSKTLDLAVADGLVSFLHEFAGVTHHLKEEQVLFPAIDAKAFFPGCGLVSEHQIASARLHEMAAAVKGASADQAEARRIFVRQARSYISLLRTHIAKEDECLANTCARTFNAEDAVRLHGEFGALERREVGESALERFAARLDALEARFEAENPTNAM